MPRGAYDMEVLQRKLREHESRKRQVSEYAFRSGHLIYQEAAKSWVVSVVCKHLCIVLMHFKRKFPGVEISEMVASRISDFLKPDYWDCTKHPAPPDARAVADLKVGYPLKLVFQKMKARLRAAEHRRRTLLMTVLKGTRWDLECARAGVVTFQMN